MFSSILPVYGLSFEMQFTSHSSPGAYHQGALTAWLRTVLGSSEGFSECMCLALHMQNESHFKVGDHYRFSVYGVGEQGKECLARIPSAIVTCQRVWDAAMPFRDNWLLHRISAIGGGSIQNMDHIPQVLNRELLQQKVSVLQQQSQITINLISPLRVLKSSLPRQGLKGEHRYCHSGADLIPDNLWLTRIIDSLRRMLENYGGSLEAPPPSLDLSVIIKVDWVNASYKNSLKKIQPMGGLLGEIIMLNPEVLAPEHLNALIIGEYLGFGQRRVFGNGRFRL